MYHYTDGNKKEIKQMSDQEFARRSTTTPTDFPLGWRLYPGRTSAGLYQVEFTSPVSDSIQIQCEYVRALEEMYEVADTAYTGSSTTKVLTTNDLAAKVSVGQYLRVDGDNQWTKITAVAADTTTGDGITVETLRTAPDNTDAITICDAPDMPYMLHKAIFYGACMLTASEQNDPALKSYVNAYSNALDLMLASQNRVRYGTRRAKLGNWR